MKTTADSKAKSLAAKEFEKYANLADLDDAELEEIMKQFTPEQLAKCPHLKDRSASKIKK